MFLVQEMEAGCIISGLQTALQTCIIAYINVHKSLHKDTKVI